MKSNKIYIPVLLISIGILVFSILKKNHWKKTLEDQTLFVKEYSGKQIRVPDSLLILYDGELTQPGKFDLFSGEYKICTSIDGDCSDCVSDLEKWRALVDSINVNNNVKFLFYINTTNLKTFIQQLYPNISLEYPLIIDTLNLYCTLNHISNDDKLHNSFLLNRENKVLISGNPIKGDAIKRLYYSEVFKNN